MPCNADVIVWHRFLTHALGSHQSKHKSERGLGRRRAHTTPPSPLITLCEVSDCLAVHGGGGESDGLEGVGSQTGWTGRTASP